jgi:putative FmdB family regulatory protein
MPTYEYQCQECGRVFDVFQSIKAAPLRKTHCATCGTPRPVRRLIGTGGAVLFKGSGFYQTDYRSKSYHDKAKAESGGAEPAKKDSAAKPASSSATKTDASKKDNSAPKE